MLTGTIIMLIVVLALFAATGGMLWYSVKKGESE